MSDPWEDEGFGGENSWGEESVEVDLEEEPLIDPIELDDLEFMDDETEDDDL
jgi:hypothetical protein